MPYADDLIVVEESYAKLRERFGEWQKALESKGLKVNMNKTGSRTLWIEPLDF